MVTLLVVGVTVTVLVAVTPGDPAQVAAGEYATPERVEAIRVSMRLDEPLPVRIVAFIADAARGQLGTSVQVQPGAEVRTLVARALPATLSLAVLSLLIAVVAGVAVGCAAGVRPGSTADRAVTLGASVLLAVPPFVLGPALVAAVAVNRGWLPATGYVPLSRGLGDWFRHLLLPAVALAVIPMAEMARQTRSAIMDVSERDFVRTAVSKGLDRSRVLLHHVGRNIAPILSTVLALQVVRVIGSAVIIERVFAIGGIGSLAVDAVLRRDLPVVQGLVLVLALMVVAVNIVVDVIHERLNPHG